MYPVCSQNKFSEYTEKKSYEIQVTLKTSKFSGPGINFERSKVRVFKSSEYYGLADGFLNKSDWML